MTILKLFNYLPYINIYVELPGLSIKVAMLYKRHDTDTIEYSTFLIRFLRWEFGFSIYETAERLSKIKLPWKKKNTHITK